MSAGDASVRSLQGVFGGTFNPVHFGHLRSALELVESLQMEHLRLMPSARPPHREVPDCSAEHRAAMLQLAVAGEPRLSCDPRELQRSGKSYTIDSLLELRDELGEGVGLCMVLGCDALLHIAEWHRWHALLDCAHIIVLARPGWVLPQSGEVARWLAAHRLKDSAALRRRPAGGILIRELRPLAISSTEVRELLQRQCSARYLLPEPVLDYIQRNSLYQ
ncbi:MAG: nicotinate-nucleotide adenylyltransferase [Halieaceae bacterium]|nr:nicotinate-nucleotide adenylyltransferase [Halieaceae bacterium]